MIKPTAAVFFSALLAVSLPASAHTEEYFDTHPAPHGGQMRMAGPYHLELVTTAKEIKVYVSDHGDNKINTEGAVAKATVQTGKDAPRATIKLDSAGDNVLKGTGDFTITPDTAVVVFVKLPHHEAESARFTPLRKKSDGDKSSAEDHEHHHHNMQPHDKADGEHGHGHHH